MTKPGLLIACLQMNAGALLETNLQKCEALIFKASRQKVQLAALPENFLWRGASGQLESVALLAPRILKHFQSLARRLKMSLLLGSLIESAPQKGKFYNTSILINRSGRVAAKYHKIHLFDIAMGRKLKVQESKHILPGKRMVTGFNQKIRMGLSICYDVRFSELYRAMSRAGCRLAFVPANFTHQTGKAHWEVLLRARAIENQLFVVAPAQTGKNPENGILSFGHSLIVDPWGEVLARGSGDREELVTARLDFASLERVRRQFPVLEHRRLFTA